jgi:hypothetical protein
MAEVVSRTGGERTKLDWKSWEEFPPPRLPIGIPVVSLVFILIAAGLLYFAASGIPKILTDGKISAVDLALYLLPFALPVAVFIYLLRPEIAARFGPYTATGVKRPERPMGVTLVAVLHFIYAALAVMGLVYYFNLVTAAERRGEKLGEIPTNFFGCLSVLTVVTTIVLVLLMISVGRGILQLRTSGRGWALTIAAIMFLAGPVMVLSAVSGTQADIWVAVGIVGSVALAVGSLAVSYGLWKLRNWARLLAVTYFAVAALVFALQLFALQALLQALLAVVVGIFGVVIFTSRAKWNGQLRMVLAALSVIVALAIPMLFFAGEWGRLIPVYTFMLLVFMIVYLVWPNVVEEFDKAEAW